MSAAAARPRPRSRSRSAGSAVGYPEDFPVGEPRRSTTSTGTWCSGATRPATLHVQDAFCPHLGAHLGHGGTVEGCEIKCPFHGWKFDAEGANTDIPYSERTNRKAHARAPTRWSERNGVRLAWYHPDDERADVGGRGGRRVQRRPASVQPDPHAHHHVDAAACRRWPRTASTPPTSATCTTPPRCRRSRATRPTVTGTSMQSSQKFPTPARRGRRAASTPIADGPGVSIVRFSGIVDTLLVARHHPDRRRDQRRPASTSTFADHGRREDQLATSGEAFADEVDKQFLEDMPIWEHKAHLVRPALADNDGPFMKFRKWYAAVLRRADQRRPHRVPAAVWPGKMPTRPRPRPPPAPSSATTDQRTVLALTRRSRGLLSAMRMRVGGGRSSGGPGGPGPVVPSPSGPPREPATSIRSSPR